MAAPVKKVPIHLQSSQNRLLIKNGKIVNATGMQDGDVFVEDGIVKQIAFSEQLSTPTGKGMRHEGQRNLQGTSFSISTELGDTTPRSTIRVHNPPGGRSSGGFW
ncbi:hypothetical protein ONE63_007638 [Megalurothrips usitatus]|uniref:Uncharacterized protein n=1 Tax=Megalurothrips usitatus TaxID=439358 RepID=A0AAV7XVY8_9NEOP|nr:hypothetical protein ONE63_007638 [Megalurothrips usitatus]